MRRTTITAARTLPVSAKHREFTVKVNGEAVPRSQHLLAATVRGSANKIASARLVYQDGAAAAGDFPLSNAETFVPGAEVEILAGGDSDAETLFKGVVVKHSIKVREVTSPQLIVECKHKATKLTVARRSAYFFEQTDSDVIGQIFSDADVDAEVESTSLSHPQLTQFDATDWDFCLLRAQANGLFIFTNGDAVAIKAPAVDGSSVCQLQFGSTVLEADLEIDARYQYSAVKANSWDPANQELVEVEGADPAISDPGNLDSSTLAGTLGLDNVTQRHPALGSEEAQQWADAKWRYSQANRICGSVKTEGMAEVKSGDVVTLDGMGERFNGTALVTGVRHDFDLIKGWKTYLQFGGVDELENAAANVTAPLAGGLLPAAVGLQIGVVVSNEDPDGEFRVRVKLPMVNNDDEGAWARVAALDAGDNRGFVFRPEVGDEVVVGFFASDPRHAVILGMLHSSAKAAPEQPSDDNHIKLYQSREGMKVSFDDENIVLTLETPEGNKVVLSEADSGITLSDQNDNKIVMNADGITIESASALTLKAASDLTCETDTSLSFSAGTEVKIEGSAGVEVSSSATTKVKGSLLQLN